MTDHTPASNEHDDRDQQQGRDAVRTGEQNVDRQQAVQVMRYLAKAQELVSKTIRDMDDYPQHLRFGDVPRDDGRCRSIAWCDDEEAWLRIERQDCPVVPELPDECQPWVDHESLEDPHNVPQLRREILNPEWDECAEEEPESPDAGPVEENFEHADGSPVPQWLVLSDFFQVTELWELYLEDWTEWASRCCLWEQGQQAYEQLYTIHRTQRRESATQEVVLGVGVLTWQTGHNHTIRRPLLTVPVTVDLDASSGEITVLRSGPSTGCRLELDMLEINERPEGDDLEEVVRQIAEIACIVDRKSVLPLLNSLTNLLSADARFDRGLAIPCSPRRHPRVSFSPVLISRPHDQRPFFAALQTARKQLEGGGPITSAFGGSVGQQNGTITLGGQDDGSPSSGPTAEDVLFPHAANDEQRRIVRRLQGQGTMVVKGPPGTGKTQTILNLMCHSLANGKRVLVTSAKPNPLQEISKRLLEDMRPLCVSILGKGQQDLVDMRSAVDRLLSDSDALESGESQASIRRLTEKRRDCRSGLAELQNRQADAREQDTLVHEIPGCGYRGTPTEIARRVVSEEDDYSWLPDAIEPGTSIPMSGDELVELSRLHESLSGDDFRKMAGLSLPPVESIPASDRVRSVLETLTAIRSQANRIRSKPSMDRVTRSGLLACPDTEFERFVEAVEEAIGLHGKIQSRKHDWLQRGLGDLLANRGDDWNRLSNDTHELLKQWTHLLGAGNREPDYEVPGTVSRSQLRADALDLADYFEKGGKTFLSLVRKEPVGRTRYLWKKSRVNGRLCDCPERLSELVRVLDFEERLEQLLGGWQQHVPCPSRGMVAAARHIESLDQDLNSLFRLKALVAQIRDMSALPVESLQAGELGNWLNGCRDQVRQLTVLREEGQAIEAVSKLLEEIRLTTSRASSHWVIEQLSGTVESEDIDGYSSACDKLVKLNEKATRARQCDALDTRLSAVAPLLADELANGRKNVLDGQLGHWEGAWNWRQARTWLEQDIEHNKVLDLHQLIIETEKQEQLLTADLVVARAWDAAAQRLGDDPEAKGSLRAWLFSLRKLGTGQSKYSNLYRRDVQSELKNALRAIPALVMPFQSVLDNVEIAPGVFDVVIIDEASQLETDKGLLLQYLAKQTIVVGDEHQLSPPSFNRIDAAQSLREKYLGGVAHSQTLLPGASFFDHCLARADGELTLRQHFRCMPEIIGFSNRIAYSNAPLFPMRVYSPNRLNPIETRFVANGLCEGDGQKIHNRPEAVQLVQALKRCVEHPDYEGMSFGVICLQGYEQADIIDRMLLRELGPRVIEEREIKCGNVYSFQGDERDIMFVSMVVANECERRFNARTSEADRQQYNVAISRARDQLWLFHSVRSEDLKSGCLRRQLIEYCEEPLGILCEGSLDVCESKFQRRVAEELELRGFRLVPEFPLGGKRIDIMVQGTNSQVAIECDGDYWHGPEQYPDDMARQRLLERLGAQFIRIRESAFYLDRAGEMQRVVEKLDDLGITPNMRPAAEDGRAGVASEMDDWRCTVRQVGGYPVRLMLSSSAW